MNIDLTVRELQTYKDKLIAERNIKQGDNMKTYRELLIFLLESGAKQIAVGCIIKTGTHEETVAMPKLSNFLTLAKWSSNLQHSGMIDMSIAQNVIFAIRW